MAFEKRLLQRIDEAAPRSSRELNVDPGIMLESVIDHLRKMFNVRQGSVVTLPDYGMPDFNDILNRYDNPITPIRNVIREIIEKYEPRLARVNVVYVPDDDDILNLRFHISAHLVIEGEVSDVAFETVIAREGKVNIKR